MSDPSPLQPAQDIAEYPYRIRTHYMLAAMAIVYAAIATALEAAARAHLCVLRDDENCFGSEWLISLEYGLLSVPLAVFAVLAFARRNKVGLRLAPEYLEVTGVLGARRYAYRDTTGAWLIRKLSGSYIHLVFGVIPLGPFRIPARWLDIPGKWLADDATFESLCRALESRTGRTLVTVDKTIGKTPVTWKALVIAIGIPGFIVGMLYINSTFAAALFLLLAAAVLGYAAWLLGDVIYKLVEKK